MSKKRAIVYLVVVGLLAILIPIIVFVFNFRNQIISDHLSDWADFATFFSGIVSIFLSAINIYIFFRLTEMAASINRNSMQKQLVQNTFKLYQQSINKLSLEFLSCIEIRNLNNYQSEDKDLERVKNRLAWISLFSKSFLDETEQIIPNKLYNEMNGCYQVLQESIRVLLQSNFDDVDDLKAFMSNKSVFLKNVNNIIHSYYEENE